jgi:hypothetical protein
MGVLEVQGLMQPDATDKFMTTLLRSVSGFGELYLSYVWTLISYLANLTTRYRRTAFGLDRDLSFTLAFPRRKPRSPRPKSGSCRRDIPKM